MLHPPSLLHVQGPSIQASVGAQLKEAGVAFEVGAGNVAQLLAGRSEGAPGLGSLFDQGPAHGTLR